MLDRLAQWIKRMPVGPNARKRLELMPSGFALFDNGRLVGAVDWLEVQEIVAYKTDELMWDTIWLEFAIPSRNEIFTISEEVAGFWDVVSEVKKVFPRSIQDWEQQVVQPPFATKTCRLYQRQPSA